MKNRSLGIIGRLLKVITCTVLIVSSVHLGARVAWLFVLSNYPRRSGATIWDYWDYISDDSFEIIYSHFVGAVIAAISAGILYGLFYLLRYIIMGPREYYDPCHDNRRCPCPRHRVEEENARAARMAAVTAATTAAVTTTIIN